MALNVYLSSPYKHLVQERQAFIELTQARYILYNIVGMEHYLAADKPSLDECLEDVRECNIYVLIVGDNYGSIADVSTGKSYTHLEYDEANRRKKNGERIERLVFLKNLPKADELPELTHWKDEIGNLGVLIKQFSDLNDLPKLILASLDKFVENKIQSVIQPKDNLNDLVYLCDRKQVEQEFEFAIYEDDAPTGFFVLSGHDDDLPRYFFRRNEIKYIERDLKWDEIKIQPKIPDGVTEFRKAEFFIKNEIYAGLDLKGLKLKKIRGPADVSVDGLVEYMTEKKLNYLAITWQIERVSLKNKKLVDFLAEFHNTYENVARGINTDKKIFFFIVLRYMPAFGITEDEFYKEAEIPWKNKLSRLSKINIDDIKTWLEDNEIETLEALQEDLIGLYLKDFNKTDGVYYKNIERGLLNILNLYKNK